MLRSTWATFLVGSGTRNARRHVRCLLLSVRTTFSRAALLPSLLLERGTSGYVAKVPNGATIASIRACSGLEIDVATLRELACQVVELDVLVLREPG